MQAVVHAADVQDRDGGVLLMASLFGLFPFLLRLYADSGYQGPKFQQGLRRVCRGIDVAIVKRSDAGKFVVLPKRWVVERTIAWYHGMKRLRIRWERRDDIHEAFLGLATCIITFRHVIRLC